MNLTPRSDVLVQEIAKIINHYLEGAYNSPETCIKILYELSNWENEICNEERALRDSRHE